MTPDVCAIDHARARLDHLYVLHRDVVCRETLSLARLRLFWFVLEQTCAELVRLGDGAYVRLTAALVESEADR